MPNRGGRDLPNMPNRKKAFKFSEPFDSVTLKTTVDATIGIFLSKNDVSLGFTDGSAVSVSGQVVVSNSAAARVPVDVGGGNVQVTAKNVGINNDDTAPVPTRAKLAGAIVHTAPVAVGTVAVQLLATNTARRGARFRNTGASAVAIGGAAVTFATATDIIMPGETWNEIDAPGATWYAICDAGNASSINISTVQ